MRRRNRDTVEEYWQFEILEACIQSSQSIQTEDFLKQLSSFLDTTCPIWAFQSARVALSQLLATVLPPEKTTVLICSFNCPAVADAVVRAGCQIETYDLSTPLGRIDWELLGTQLRPSHGAIIIPHLFGVPYDFRLITQAAKNLGILIVEDCSHTLGAYVGEAMAGTIGDAAIFSFNFDKPISLGGGGALLINNSELCKKIDFRHQTNRSDIEQTELLNFVNYLRTRRHQIHLQGTTHKFLRRLLQRLGLDFTVPLISTAGIGPIRAALGIWQLENYSHIIQKRNANASFFQNQQGFKSWYVSPKVLPAWLKQKIVPNAPENGFHLSKLLQSQGIRIGYFNWNQTIDSYLRQPEKPNSAFAAHYSLDIPIHQNMTLEELQYIREILA